MSYTLRGRVQSRLARRWFRCWPPAAAAALPGVVAARARRAHARRRVALDLASTTGCSTTSPGGSRCRSALLELGARDGARAASARRSARSGARLLRRLVARSPSCWPTPASRCYASPMPTTAASSVGRRSWSPSPSSWSRPRRLRVGERPPTVHLSAGIHRGRSCSTVAQTSSASRRDRARRDRRPRRRRHLRDLSVPWAARTGSRPGGDGRRPRPASRWGGRFSTASRRDAARSRSATAGSTGPGPATRRRSTSRSRWRCHAEHSGGLPIVGGGGGDRHQFRPWQRERQPGQQARPSVRSR